MFSFLELDNKLVDYCIDTTETKIGKFKNAIDPKTNSFREFPDWVKKFKEEVKNKDTKIAMYCTGGIRCEKSTSLMKKEGFNNVFHLEGGILKYLEKTSDGETLWDGECFVFDERVWESAKYKYVHIP